MSPWLRYAISFVVFVHGLVYVRIGSVLPGPITGWRGTSLVLGGFCDGDQLKRLAISLHVAAGIALFGCAAAIAFAPSVPEWWRPTAIVGATLGLLAFAVFWDGQTHLLVDEGLIGAVLSAVLLTAALTFP